MLDPGSLPLPGYEPAPEESVRYVVYADGSLSRFTADEGLEPVLTNGGRLVTQDEYDELRAQMQTAHDERVAALLASDEQRQRQAYEDLRAAGIPETTARSLSGWSG